MSTQMTHHRYELWRREDANWEANIEWMIFDLEDGRAYNWYDDELQARYEFKALINGKEEHDDV